MTPRRDSIPALNHIHQLITLGSLSQFVVHVAGIVRYEAEKSFSNIRASLPKSRPAVLLCPSHSPTN